MAALTALLAQFCVGQNQIPITLESSETIFSVLTALNACGYDQDLTISDATRSNVRAEVQRALSESAEAEASRAAVCDYYQKHVASKDANRNLSQYISLALYLDGPPHFMPRLKVEELPPDAAAIAPFGAVLEHFYEKANLHAIWERHRNDYSAAMNRYHEPLVKMVFDTEVYLKQPSSQYLGRTFTIYVDFMGSPNETDARNYGSAYYVVMFPAPNTTSGSAARSDQRRRDHRFASHGFLVNTSAAFGLFIRRRKIPFLEFGRKSRAIVINRHAEPYEVAEAGRFWISILHCEENLKLRRVNARRIILHRQTA